jgi:hypothetical protein
MHSGALNASSERRPFRRLTIIVAGMIAGDPYQGGATWAVLQYLLGLRQLGHDVHFIEPVPAAKCRPRGRHVSCTANAPYFREVMRPSTSMRVRALLLAGTRRPWACRMTGCGRSRPGAMSSSTSQACSPIRRSRSRVPVRVYLDLDPGFNQLWYAAEGLDVGFDGHTHFATIGLALGERRATSRPAAAPGLRHDNRSCSASGPGPSA